MKTKMHCTSTCSRCHFFQPESRHRGTCNQLDITVGGELTACHLAQPAFAVLQEAA